MDESLYKNNHFQVVYSNASPVNNSNKNDLKPGEFPGIMSRLDPDPDPDPDSSHVYAVFYTLTLFNSQTNGL